MVVVRRASVEDLTGIRTVSLELGIDEVDSGADESYVRSHLEGGFVAVAEDGGAVLGWAALHPGRLGWLLADLFVVPFRHGEGIGGELARFLFSKPASDASLYTFSSQHPSALPLYLSEGLVPSWPLLYLRGVVPAVDPAGLTARKVAPEEAAGREALLLDRAGLAAPPRRADYRLLTIPDGASAIAVLDGGTTIAVGAVRRSQLAHLVCTDPASSAAAALAALRATSGGEVDVCLPGPHPAVPVLLDAGFRVTSYDIAMTSPGLCLPPGWAYHPGLT